MRLRNGHPHSRKRCNRKRPFAARFLKVRGPSLFRKEGRSRAMDMLGARRVITVKTLPTAYHHRIQRIYLG
jgi:hypothetical protein